MGQTNSFDCCSRGIIYHFSKLQINIGISEGRSKDDNQRLPLIPPPTADSVKNSMSMLSSCNLCSTFIFNDIQAKIREHFKSHENLFTRLVAHRQDHILANVDDLKEDELEKFYDSLYDIDFEMMDMVIL